MTPDQAKQRLLELAHEQAAVNRSTRTISHAEMIAEIEAAGWTPEPACEGSTFWKDPTGELLIAVQPETAIAVIWRREKERQRKQQMDAGTLVCDCNACGADCRKYDHDGKCM